MGLSQGERPGERRLAALDGLRGIAILSVMAFHYTVRWTAPRDPADHLPGGAIFNAVTPLHYGWAGVDLFFIVSGFVIVMTLERCAGLADFALRRAARLWPPMLVVGSATALILNLFGPREWGVNVPSYLLSVLFVDPVMIGKLLHFNAHWIDGVYWTLWVEVRFYAVFSVFYFLFRRDFLKKWILLQGAAYLLYAAIPIGAAKAALQLLVLAPTLAYFTLGVCLYKLRFEPESSRRTAGIGAAVAVACIVAERLLGPPSSDGTALGALASDIVVLALAAWFMAGPRWNAALSSAPLVRIGQASYSLYLMHQLLGVMALQRLTAWGAPMLLAAPLVAAGMIGLALCAYRFIEIPGKDAVMRLGRFVRVSRRATPLDLAQGGAPAREALRGETSTVRSNK